MHTYFCPDNVNLCLSVCPAVGNFHSLFGSTSPSFHQIHWPSCHTVCLWNGTGRHYNCWNQFMFTKGNTSYFQQFGKCWWNLTLWQQYKYLHKDFLYICISNSGLISCNFLIPISKQGYLIWTYCVQDNSKHAD